MSDVTLTSKNMAMHRSSGTTISGMLPSGHYFFIEKKAGAIEMTVSDGAFIAARYFQASDANIEVLAAAWIDAFLAGETVQKP